MECFLEDIERGKLIYNYKPQFMGNRNFEVVSVNVKGKYHLNQKI